MNKTALIILAVIAIGALLFLFTKPPAVTPPVEKVTPENITPGASLGDMVTINFVLSLENGTVVDTNNAQLAEQYGITNFVKGPYTFILGQSGKVAGFDEALLGMREGDHRETFIEPTEQEIVLNVNKTRIMNRMITINRKQSFPLKSFETMFKKPPIKGDLVFNNELAFKYQVINVTEDKVIANIYAKEGEEYTLPNTEWKSKVALVSEEDILFYQDPKENQTLITPFGTAAINLTKSRIILNFEPELNKIFNKSIEIAGTQGFSIPQSFQVIEIHDDYFTIKRVGLLTDKRLKLVADLTSMTKDVKEVRQKRPIITEVVGGTEN
jgi:hypothetical protein